MSEPKPIPEETVRAVLEQLIRDKDEEIERLQQALSDLADRLEYKGNSISWIHSKAEKYGRALLDSWRALNEAGIKQDRDEPFDVVEGIRRLAARMHD